MPISYEYDPDSGTVNTTATGVVTTREVLDYLRAVLSDGEIDPGFLEVVRFEELRDFVVRYSEAAPFEALWQEYLKKGCRGTVIHAPTDSSFGTTRMLQTVVQLSDASAADRFVVVRSEDEVEASLKRLRA